MKRKWVVPVFTFVFIFVMLFNMVGLAINSFWYDINDLPKGQHLRDIPCPDNKSVLSIYEVNVPDIGYGIRGEIANLDKNGNRQTRNIYWETGTRKYNVTFLDADTIIINDHEVHINGEPYDSRRQIELPEASAKNRLRSN